MTTQPGHRTGEPEPDARVDDLRQQLRALGYLDAGVDRFVLAPALERRRPTTLAVLASIRIGILSAVLLGPAAAIGLGSRVPGLVSGVRDALVLAIYLGALFFVAAAVLSTIVCLMAASLAKVEPERQQQRSRLVSATAGWTIAIACLTYLTLWWRTANAGFGWSAPGLTATALLVAVIISLLLGHAVRIATLAVIAAEGQGHLPRVTATSWRWVIAGGVVAFLGAAALLIWTAPATAAEPVDRPALTVVSTGRRVRLFAVDGIDPVVFRELAAAGKIPALAAASAHGRVPLRARDTSDPARTWTTIATGQPPDVHGVRSIETRRVAGVQGIVSAEPGTIGRLIRTGTDLVRLTRPSVASREERRAKTLWEVAAEAGLRTAVVNWWATWPASPDAGIVVTDRALLRLEHGGSLDAEIAPAALYDTLRQGWPAIRQRALERAAPASQLSSDATVAAILRRSAEIDQTLIELRAALPGPTRDLDIVYLPGLDIAQHALLSNTDGAALAASAVAARLEGLRNYYAFLDRALGPSLAAADGEMVMLLTEPGRVHSSDSGLLAITGAGASIDASSEEAESVNVAPTILYALGVPLSRELPGTYLSSLFDRDFASKHPPRFVATYGPPNVVAGARAGQPLDQEMIDRLRSLGYVK